MTIVYAYPELSASGEEITYQNVQIPAHLKHLYAHLVHNGFVRGIESSDTKLFNIHSQQILSYIRHNQLGWEDNVPEPIVELIKTRHLFGYNSR